MKFGIVIILNLCNRSTFALGNIGHSIIWSECRNNAALLVVWLVYDILPWLSRRHHDPWRMDFDPSNAENRSTGLTSHPLLPQTVSVTPQSSI